MGENSIVGGAEDAGRLLCVYMIRMLYIEVFLKYVPVVEMEEALIEAVCSLICLWKIDDKHYSDRVVKDNAWKEVSDKVRPASQFYQRY